MVDSTENILRNRISKKRKIEMSKYGRTKMYDEISTFLFGNRRTAFSLVNHSLAMMDDNIDTTTNTKRLERAKKILTKAFENEKISIKQDWENDISKLGQKLLLLHKEGFVFAADIFHEVINYWNIEDINLSRKGILLKSSILHKLNLDIGRSIGIQFLFLLCPELDKKTIASIASTYGISIKLADNLSDLKEDLEKGFINISAENIKKYHIKITKLSQKDLNGYIKEELSRIKRAYQKGDRVLGKCLQQFPSSREGLLIFQKIAHTWLKQVSEIYGNNRRTTISKTKTKSAIIYIKLKKRK